MNSRGWEAADYVSGDMLGVWLIVAFFAFVFIGVAYNEIKDRWKK